MHRSLVPLCFAIALAACGSPDADADGDGEITMQEAAEASKDMVKPEPGQYRSTVEFVNLEMPDAEPEVRDMMTRMMAGNSKQTHEFCLTPEEAEKGFEEMAKESNAKDECVFEKFENDGGRIDAVMRCGTEEQGTMRVAMNGTGGKTSSEMTMTMDAKAPDGGTMKMTMKNSQERIGDCEGNAAG